MENHTFFHLFTSEIIFHLHNKTTQLRLFLYACISLAIGTGVYFLMKDEDTPLNDALTAGVMTFIFLLSFYTISSVSREIADGTVSLSLRFVPTRGKLFLVRMMFYPTMTFIVSLVLSSFTIPFIPQGTQTLTYILDSVIYSSFIWSLITLLVFFIATIFRKGAISALVSIVLMVLLPLFMTLSPLFMGTHKFFTWLSTHTHYTPTLAISNISSFQAINQKIEGFDGEVVTALTTHDFLIGWATLLAWLVVLAFFAWKVFQRESTVSA
ncbi:MAG: hypothetical protein J6M18_04690 [Actinomycetaceae bacterium]|nr:hypothetical protein [Actinomycetaceae bacterium]